MRPPECDVCGARFDPAGGGLIRFHSRPSDVEWRSRVEREGLVGHPPDTGWFCSQHRPAAEALTELALPDALVLIESGLPVAGVVRHFDDFGPLVELVCRRIEAVELFERLIESVPEFAAAAGLAPAGEMSRSTQRRWSPMDGAVPPDCPYGDVDTVASGEAVSVTLERNYWNPETLANASVRMSLEREGVEPALLSVGGSTDHTDGTSAPITSLSIFPPMDVAFLGAVGRFLDSLANG